MDFLSNAMFPKATFEYNRDWQYMENIFYDV
jgi:hypothetical protein